MKTQGRKWRHSLRAVMYAEPHWGETSPGWYYDRKRMK